MAVVELIAFKDFENHKMIVCIIVGAQFAETVMTANPWMRDPFQRIFAVREDGTYELVRHTWP